MARDLMGTAFLTRLSRDTRGNTLALVAAMMMPLIGLIGGGVDMSRLYLTRARLQQACDAGALAGRKAMGGGAWTTTANGSRSKADAMFTANFRSGDYGSTGLASSFTEQEGVVTGGASVAIPMTLMRVFGFSERSVTVACSAKMAIPNTDVMFVLDVTGSMNCVAGDTSCTNNNNVPAPGSKIFGLRSAIKCFYEALMKVNTTEVCTTNDPTATTASTTAQIRIGFMPYAVNVNVGKLLPQAYIADEWTYQTRVPIRLANIFMGWTYKQDTLDVSGLKKSDGNWNNSVALPVGKNGGNSNVNWDGCIEEAQTFRNTDGDTSDDWSPIPTSALDMDINLIPSNSRPGSKWGPMLEGAVWGRYTVSYQYGNSYISYTQNNITSNDNLSNVVNYSCPIEASRLRTYNTATDLETYVNKLTGIGNTYHDIGLLWGARFISPVGIFAKDNAKTATGGQIQRHIIYMTDGDVRSFDTDYNAYGVTYWDRRQKSGTPDNAPTNNYSDDNQYNQMINARLVALCSAVKNMNITLWVISYGGGINEATETRLRNCATPGHYFTAANNTTLISRFQSIAAAISELRLTQ